VLPAENLHVIVQAIFLEYRQLSHSNARDLIPHTWDQTTEVAGVLSEESYTSRDYMK